MKEWRKKGSKKEREGKCDGKKKEERREKICREVANKEVAKIGVATSILVAKV